MRLHVVVDFQDVLSVDTAVLVDVFGGFCRAGTAEIYILESAPIITCGFIGVIGFLVPDEDLSVLRIIVAVAAHQHVLGKTTVG